MEELLAVIDSYSAEILDDSMNSFTIQLTGAREIIDDFVGKIPLLGDVHALARSGSVAVTKGEITLSSYANQNLAS